MKTHDADEMNDDLRPECDLEALLKTSKPNRFAGRYAAGTNLVPLAPDVAEAFKDVEAVVQGVSAMTTIELTQPALVGKIEHLASALQQPVEQVLEAAVQDYLDRLEGDAIQQESDAFRSMYPQLTQEYPGQFVAIQGGQVVDHDADVTALEQRVNERFKWHPVLIAPLTPPPAELHWRGARLSEKDGV